jgi:hypothetical protein
LRSSGTTERRVERGRSRSGLTRELILGVILLLIGACVVFVLLSRGKAPVPVVSDVVDVPTQNSPGLVEPGKALVPAFVETGDFPPMLSPGDKVLVVVLPHQSPDGVARALPQDVSVAELSPDDASRSGAVVTLLGPENLAREIADAERVHLSIVMADGK